MKPEERLFFGTFLGVRPDFLDLKSWVPGPDPPDVIVTDARGRRFGLELTEWLDKEQTTPSIAYQEKQFELLNVLDTENSSPPHNFQTASVWFRMDVRFSRFDLASFRKEFYELMAKIDAAWSREMAREPQKIWNDFSSYPTLAKHVYLIRFEDRMPIRPRRWALGTPQGGAYDPRRATEAFLERIEEKKSKPNYAPLKSQYGLAELVLLVHYGIRGILHNTPFDGLNWKLQDTISEARTNLATDAGAFDRVFLYLAYNEGQLFNLYPGP